MKKLKLIIPLLLALPAIASAQFEFNGIKGIIDSAGFVVSRLILVVAGIALLVFFWGLVKFIFKAGDEKSIQSGRQLMIWGIVALFVMVSVWGLVFFIRQELFPTVGNYDAPKIPAFPTQ